MPHLSHVPRKPKPLGAEIKSLCDGVFGCMLFLELQEGKVCMARKPYCDRYKATAAYTMRLACGAGLSEKEKRPEDKVGRVVVELLVIRGLRHLTLQRHLNRSLACILWAT